MLGLSIGFWILIVVLVINVTAAIITVFKDKRDIAATWAWLLVLFMLPIVGFIIYLFVGKKISSNRLFDLQEQEKLGIDQLVDLQKTQWDERDLIPKDEVLSEGNRELTRLFLDIDHAILTKHNQVKIYTDGLTKFAALIKDIKQAKDHIHIEYYTFYDDKIGNQILRILEKKALQGVKVRIIYDSLGSRGMRHNFFRQLEKNGGEAEPFFGTKSAPIHSPRINYRDHRKVVVIDGKVGYIGGFNIGDQYLGRMRKFGYWRDTHIRVVGNVVAALQTRFLMDWNATVKNVPNAGPIRYQDNYYPLVHGKGKTSIQIVSSGPDNDRQAIRRGYFKMINNARKYVYIQTPYLIPDDSIMDALEVAKQSGVDVRVMIPCMPDHPFVYRATEYYAKQLTEQGVKIYRYDKGFLHSKTVVVDDQISSVGSANLDFRSFKLNFEANAFLYGNSFAKKMKQIFEKDEQDCTLLDNEFFAKQSWWRKFKQYFSRLLSPIL